MLLKIVKLKIHHHKSISYSVLIGVSVHCIVLKYCNCCLIFETRFLCVYNNVFLISVRQK